MIEAVSNSRRKGDLGRGLLSDLSIITSYSDTIFLFPRSLVRSDPNADNTML